MTTPTFEDAVSRIVRKDPRFAERAYSFLKDALDFTMQRIEEQENGMSAGRNCWKASGITPSPSSAPWPPPY